MRLYHHCLESHKIFPQHQGIDKLWSAVVVLEEKRTFMPQVDLKKALNLPKVYIQTSIPAGACENIMKEKCQPLQINLLPMFHIFL